MKKFTRLDEIDWQGFVSSTLNEFVPALSAGGEMNAQKLEELMIYLGSHPKVQDLGSTKLWKLIYLIDSKSKREFGDSVTGSEFIKYPYGPVPSRGEKHLRKMIKSGALLASQRKMGDKTLNEVKSKREADKSLFCAGELEIMDSICAEFGGNWAITLSMLSHREPSWHYAESMNKLSPELMSYGCAEDPEGL